MEELRRTFNEDSVSERRDERVVRRSLREEDEVEVAGSGVFEGDGADSGVLLPSNLFYRIS